MNTGGNKGGKPLKIIKVIKRVHKDGEMHEGMNVQTPTEKGAGMQPANKSEGKGKMNQGILDELTKQAKVKRMMEERNVWRQGLMTLGEK